ncbi:MAG: 30S ribosomal protein S6 [Lentisphaerae bacterium]|nr:30S ribosomal protein S6 [Lentisphaerota bacterium]
MKKYQGLIILALPVTEQTLEEKLEKIRMEIEKLKKKDAGFYVQLTFTLAPAKIAALSERFKLNPDVFRAQITLAELPGRAWAGGQTLAAASLPEDGRQTTDPA